MSLCHHVGSCYCMGCHNAIREALGGNSGGVIPPGFADPTFRARLSEALGIEAQRREALQAEIREIERVGPWLVDLSREQSTKLRDGFRVMTEERRAPRRDPVNLKESKRLPRGGAIYRIKGFRSDA